MQSSKLRQIYEDLNSRINPEKSRKFSPETFLKTREYLQRIALRSEFQSEARRISIVGTNGKGSTAFSLSAILSANTKGRVGLYVSPHLLSPLERVRVGELSASPSALLDTLEQLRAILGPEDYERFTYFEILTLASIIHFKKYECEFELYEAGLGGRLDATGTAKSQDVVLTSIGLDHTELLGESHEQILEEKLRIMGPRTERLFFYDPGTVSVKRIHEKANAISPGIEFHFFPDSPGTSHYLEFNTRFALFIAQTILEHPVQRPTQKIPGRMESFVRNGITFIFDTAHNFQAMESALYALRNDFPNHNPETSLVLLGLLPEKDPKAFFQFLEKRDYRNVLLIHAPGLASNESIPHIESIQLDSFAGYETIFFLGTHRSYIYFSRLKRENPGASD